MVVPRAAMNPPSAHRVTYQAGSAHLTECLRTGFSTRGVLLPSGALLGRGVLFNVPALPGIGEGVPLSRGVLFDMGTLLGGPALLVGGVSHGRGVLFGVGAPLGGHAQFGGGFFLGRGVLFGVGTLLDGHALCGGGVVLIDRTLLGEWVVVLKGGSLLSDEELRSRGELLGVRGVLP